MITYAAPTTVIPPVPVRTDMLTRFLGFDFLTYAPQIPPTYSLGMRGKLPSQRSGSTGSLPSPSTLVCLPVPPPFLFAPKARMSRAAFTNCFCRPGRRNPESRRSARAMGSNVHFFKHHCPFLCCSLCFSRCCCSIPGSAMPGKQIQDAPGRRGCAARFSTTEHQSHVRKHVASHMLTRASFAFPDSLLASPSAMPYVHSRQTIKRSGYNG